MARDGAFFQKMAEVHPKWRTPAFSLIGQGIWGAILTVSGRYDQLYTYVMFGMVLSYTHDGDRPVHSALEAAGHSASLPLHRISLAAGDLCPDRRRLDAEHDRHAAHGISGGTAIVLIGVPGYLYWKRMSRNASARLLISFADLCGILRVLCGSRFLRVSRTESKSLTAKDAKDSAKVARNHGRRRSWHTLAMSLQSPD